MPIFVKRDLDGFFGLFVDNLVQMLVIVALCQYLCGMTGDAAYLLWDRILPGVAVSLLLGNVFYAWQAHQVARRTGRSDVTALPYGINTPSVVVYLLFVMAPAYREAMANGLDQVAAAEIAWRIGLVACLGSGIIEFLGSFLAEAVRRRTPRAALLSTLSGIAIAFISMQFALQIWTRPILAMIPLAVVLLTFFSGMRFPLGLPGGLVAVLAGTALAWGFWLTDAYVLPHLGSTLASFDLAGAVGVTIDPTGVEAALQHRGWRLPVWCGDELWATLREQASWLKYLSLIVPMGLFNVVGSLQNIESAEAAGDRFPTMPSLAANGIGTIAACCFGSCFPTTIYIGHPGWKSLGARAGYSTLNGIVVTALCLTGTVAVVERVIPQEAAIAIVLWIGIIMTAQAFQTTPRSHAPAAAFGLFPAIAAFGATAAFSAFDVAGGKTMQDVLADDPTKMLGPFFLHGLVVLERGAIFTCMIVGAVSALLIDRRFVAAGIWCLVGALTTLTGLMHAYQLSGNVVDFLLLGTEPADGAIAFRGYAIAIGYLLFGLVLFAASWIVRRNPDAALGDTESDILERVP